MHQVSGFLDMEANIQYPIFFPGYYSTRNHNLIANGSKGTPNLSSDPLLGYYKEVLKQTMLEQDTILRGQIQDLHRLYERQRELMDEIRRNELDKHKLKIDASRLTAALSQSSCFGVQKILRAPSLPLVNRECSQVAVSGAESIQSPSCVVQGRTIHMYSYPTPTEGHSGDSELLESKCKKLKNFFDLELPADACANNKEEEFLEYGKVPEATEVSSAHLRRFADVMFTGDPEQFLGTNGFNSLAERETSTTASLGKGSSELYDLYQLGKETSPTSGDDLADLRTPIHDFERDPTTVQSLPCVNSHVPFSNLRSRKEPNSAFFLNRNFSHGSHMGPKISEAHQPHIIFDNLIGVNDNVASEHTGVTKYLLESANVKFAKDINLNSCPLDVAVSQSFQATTGAEKLEDYNEGMPWHKQKLVYIGKPDKGCEDSNLEEASEPSSKRIHGSGTGCEKPNISCDHSIANLNQPEDVKKRKGSVVLDLNFAWDSEFETDGEAADHVVDNDFDKKDAGFGLQIDLNSSINEDEFSPMSSLSRESLSEAPASPENKECSPPRGESDKHQVETATILSGQEDLGNKDCPLTIGESNENQNEAPLLSGQKMNLEELVQTAAESLVLISSSWLHACTARTTASFDSLHWFAGIASSVVDGPENNVGVVINEELLPDGMDYFEAMTLNLTETKVEEYCCRTNGHKDEEMCTISLQNQPKKGRARRGKQRKDFQTDILPSLASLSRYEVTEDLQTIGGLIEVSSNRCETGSVRYASKLGLAKGRRRSNISTSTVTKNTLESLLKQISSKSQFGKKERSVIGWGEVTRRRRGQRYPVSKPRLILSQV